MDKIIEMQNASHTYRSNEEGSRDTKAVSNVNLYFEKGRFTAVLGRNGSGKSTLARMINALLLPDAGGVVYVKGMRTDEDENLWEIRRYAGMVFQNPDNQIVATVVEDDVAFGPENLGILPEEIRRRVDEALATVGMSQYSKHAPHLLSGGQKQRVAIAGILAMKPECIILDEATAMLDPVGRKEVMQVLKKLNKNEGITIIHITHHMDEAAAADRVIVMDEGKIVMEGKPKEVFRNVEKIKALGLDVPPITELFYKLRKEGFELPDDVLSIEEAVDVIGALLK